MWEDAPQQQPFIREHPLLPNRGRVLPFSLVQPIAALGDPNRQVAALQDLSLVVDHFGLHRKVVWRNVVDVEVEEVDGILCLSQPGARPRFEGVPRPVPLLIGRPCRRPSKRNHRFGTHLSHHGQKAAKRIPSPKKQSRFEFTLRLFGIVPSEIVYLRRKPSDRPRKTKATRPQCANTGSQVSIRDHGRKPLEHRNPEQIAINRTPLAQDKVRVSVNVYPHVTAGVA